jgi:hypothetical protein
MKDRQRFNEQFIADLLSCWEKHGRSVMEIAAAKDPTNFVRIATALIPKELAVAVTNQPSSLQGLTIAVADDEHPDHQHRIDRGPTEPRIIRCQLGMHPT